jgi:hypothetical protein
VGTALVVVGDVLAKDCVEVAAAEHKRPVQAFAADRTYEAFSDSVRARGTDGVRTTLVDDAY